MTGFAASSPRYAPAEPLPPYSEVPGHGTFLHPIFGRLNSRGAFALLAFHLPLHVPQIRRSIELNGTT